MKKFIVIILLAVSMLVFAGCKKETYSGEFTLIVVDYNEEEVFNDTIAFTKDDTLLKLLQEHEDIQLKGETGSYGFYITEVCGINSADYQDTYWSLEINGEYSMVGISEVIIKDKDTVELLLIGY